MKPRGIAIPLTEPEKQRIKELSQLGIEGREIARIIGRSCGTVSKAITGKTYKPEPTSFFDVDRYVKQLFAI
jgi:IS30 family transposase